MSDEQRNTGMSTWAYVWSAGLRWLREHARLRPKTLTQEREEIEALYSKEPKEKSDV